MISSKSDLKAFCVFYKSKGNVGLSGGGSVIQRVASKKWEMKYLARDIRDYIIDFRAVSNSTLVMEDAFQMAINFARSVGRKVNDQGQDIE